MISAKNSPGQAHISCIYPSFVWHKVWETTQEFNDRLFELGKADALKNRVVDESNPLNVGDTTNHLGHLRHNFLLQCKDACVRQLSKMVDFSVREYLSQVYQYNYSGEIEMMSDTFYQSRSAKENIGINRHSHIKHDLVCTYYPRVDIDADCPKTSLHMGALRFYDPSAVGKRPWPNQNEQFHVGGWFSLQPQVGSMVIFEGHLQHDSTYFEGEERLAIPVMCRVLVPNRYVYATTLEIESRQTEDEGSEI